jgi:hypothetical protein
LTAAALPSAAHHVRHAGKFFTVTVRPEHRAPSRCT